MALTEYDKERLSPAQRAAVERATADWNAANARGDTAGTEKAHAAAEAARNEAGYKSDDRGNYSGSVFGSGGGSHGGSESFWRAGAEKMNEGLSAASAAAEAGIRQSKDNYARAQEQEYQQQLALQQKQYEQQLAAQQEQYERQRQQLEEEYRRRQQQIEEQRRAATEAAVSRTVNELEGRRASAEREYANLFRQLYIDKMRGRKNLDQRLAAQGVTGGAAESTLLSRDAAYEEALRQSEQERIAAQSGFDRAIADARLAADVESAEAAAKSAEQQAEQYAAAIKDLLARQDKLNARLEANRREDAQRAERYAREDEERRERYAREDAQREERYAREDAQTARAAARSLVQRWLDAGRMPPRELLAAAGMDETAARELLAIRGEEAEKAEREKEAAAAMPRLTAAQVNAAIKNGIVTDAVRAAYEYYYGAPYRG